MSSRHPLWLRTLHWTLVMVTLGWVTYDLVLTPTWDLPLTLSTAPLYRILLNFAGLALLVGLGHIAWFHLMRIWRAQREWPLSLALLITLTAVVTLGVTDGGDHQSPGLSWVYRHVIAPGEAGLMAATLFLLTGAYLTMLRTRRKGVGWMTAGLLIVLVLQTPWMQDALPFTWLPLLDDTAHLIVVPVTRGILLGSGILIIANALQFLVGSTEEPSAPAP